MSAVKTSLDSMLKDAPSRSILLDDEPSEVVESLETSQEPAMA
jgi:hypothetical protein